MSGAIADPESIHREQTPGCRKESQTYSAMLFRWCTAKEGLRVQITVTAQLLYKGLQAPDVILKPAGMQTRAIHSARLFATLRSSA